MDVDINVHEAEFALAHLHDWIKPRREATPIVMEPGHVRVRPLHLCSPNTTTSRARSFCVFRRLNASGQRSAV
jgi:hypothetical protein